MLEPRPDRLHLAFPRAGRLREHEGLEERVRRVGPRAVAREMGTVDVQQGATCSSGEDIMLPGLARAARRDRGAGALTAVEPPERGRRARRRRGSAPAAEAQRVTKMPLRRKRERQRAGRRRRSSGAPRGTLKEGLRGLGDPAPARAEEGPPWCTPARAGRWASRAPRTRPRVVEGAADEREGGKHSVVVAGREETAAEPGLSRCRPPTTPSLP